MVHVLNAFVDVSYSASVAKTMSPDKEAASADKLGVQALPDKYVCGEVSTMAQVNHIRATKIRGYWLGKRVGDGTLGQKAEPGAKVPYHFHGKIISRLK
jgi:hypothetical protein